MNNIYLHLEIDKEGNISIHDQGGRELAGVIGFKTVGGIDEATVLELRVYDMLDGSPWKPRQQKP